MIAVIIVVLSMIAFGMLCFVWARSCIASGVAPFQFANKWANRLVHTRGSHPVIFWFNTGWLLMLAGLSLAGSVLLLWTAIEGNVG